MRKFMRNNFSAFVLAFALVILSCTFGTAGATTTSTITVSGTDYTLFTGFTATGGSTGVGVFTYDKAVDGDMSSSWHDQSSGIFVEFNTDGPIVPKGYIFNTYQAGSFYPQAWTLKAKANTEESWTELSSYSGQTLSSGQEFQYACNNDGNIQYKYFRFEASNSNNNIWLTEIRLYGFENLTYTHLTVRAATCTETGIKQDCYLRSDGKYFTDETGATELQESDVIAPKIAHTGVHHAADENHIEYWQCSVCGKYFSDSDCTHEITEAQTLVLKYLDSNGTLTTLTENTITLESSLKDWSNGWYVVYENVTISDRITVSGTVNMILCNGATLTASKGITVGSDVTFNVYAQSTDEATMGALVASTEANSNNAAIGGVQGTNFGSIVINGGKITATTNNACGGAPIGGGYGSTAGNITINGGIVSATAYDYSNSAGIGGGNNGYVASVTLNGGIITATGDSQYGGAGIGTGAYASSGTMTITIGSGVKKIVAVKGSQSECIGKQPNASTTVNVIFKNGEATVEGDNKDVVFYDSGKGSQRQIRTKALNHAVTIADDIKASVTPDTEYALAGETVTLTLGTAVDASTLKVNNGDVSLTNTGDGKCTFTMPDGNVTVTATVAETYSVNLPTNMEIVSATNTADTNGKYISGTGVSFKASFPYTASNVSDGTNTLTATDGVYSVTVGTADITITATVQRNSTIDLSGVSENFTAENGDVLTGTTDKTVVIAEGASITLSGATINGGIVCNSNGNVTIILVGTNSVTGEYGKAGIQIGGSGTTLTIKGDGSLTATGGYDAAGIGLNRAWNVTSDVIGGNIVIEGGNIMATGGGGGAGIGAGVIKGENNSSSIKAIVGNITIKGGTVKATGGTDADGIGAGKNDYNATIEIGTVTIYDGIDLVDASSIKNFGSVVYMHGENNVTANKTDYFTIGEDGDRRLIVQKPLIAEISNQTYTGSAITPEPKVTVGSLSLTKGTDYEYSYTDNTNVGTNAKVTVTFKGDYASLGSVEKTFTIIPAVFVQSGIENGNVTADKAGAVAGETVTLTVTPGEGYNIGTVSYNDGTEHTINAVNGVYSFTMPAVSVTISVTFTPIEYTITYDLDGGTNNSNNPAKYTVEEEVELENPTKDGYTFTGWTGEGVTTPMIGLKINFGSTGNRTYTANWDKTGGGSDPDAPIFKTYQLKLEGRIEVIFYADIPEKFRNSDTTVVFDVSGDKSHNNTREFNENFKNDAGNYYGFKCEITSVQMADVITATLNYKDNSETKTVTLKCRAKDYIDYGIANETDATTLALLKAIKDYGHYVQPFLDAANDDWTLGTDHAVMDYATDETTFDGYISSAQTDVLTNYAAEIGTHSESITATYQLDLKTDTEMNIYVSPTSSVSATYLDGSVISVIQDGRYVVNIAGISAHLLGNPYTVTVKCADNSEFNIKVSALSYVNTVLQNSNDVTSRRAVTSLYKYFKATQAYREAHSYNNQ